MDTNCIIRKRILKLSLSLMKWNFCMNKPILVLILFISLFNILFVSCCVNPEETKPPSVDFPSAMVGTWYLLSTKYTSSNSVTGMPSAISNISIQESGDSYTFSSFLDNVSDSGTASWESRDNGNYLILTSADGDEKDMKILSYNNFICMATEENQTWSLVRGAGIFGVVNDDSNATPFMNTTVILSQNGSPVETMKTDLQGIYYFHSLTAGSNYVVSVNVMGYDNSDLMVLVDESIPDFSHFPLIDQTPDMSTIEGHITDSSTNYSPSDDVQVYLDDIPVTSSDGYYFIDNIENGSKTISVDAFGYNPYSRTVSVSAGLDIHNIVLNPIDVNSDDPSMISMSWGLNSTTDFDLLMLTPEINGASYSLSYTNVGSLLSPPYALHHGDHTSGPGPEEIEIESLEDGVYTIYAVASSGSEYRSEDVITTIKDDNGDILETINTSNVNSSGRYWLIAEINDSEITIINELTHTDPANSIGVELGDVTLTWMDGDGDLDLHVLTPEIDGTEYDVHFDQIGGMFIAPYMQHQGDVTTGPGPEEIWIDHYEDGIYTIFAQNHSNVSFRTTQAVIKIFNSDDTISETINATSSSGSGDYWNVAEINGSTGQITIINRCQNSQPGAASNTFVPKIKNR